MPIKHLLLWFRFPIGHNHIGGPSINMRATKVGFNRSLVGCQTLLSNPMGIKHLSHTFSTGGTNCREFGIRR